MRGLVPTAGRAVAAGAALLVAASCGVSPGHTLDPSGAETQIAAQLESQYQVTGVRVQCPSGIPDRDGQDFVCSATLAGQSLILDATVTNSGGHFSITPVQAVLAVDTTEALLAREIGAQAHAVPSVRCGSRPVLVLPIGATFSCSATFSGTSPRALAVTVETAQGRLHYVLAPAG